MTRRGILGALLLRLVQDHHVAARDLAQSGEEVHVHLRATLVIEDGSTHPVRLTPAQVMAALRD